MTKKILKKRPVSNHPGDNYLSYVLAEYKGEYVTWLYNSSFDEYNIGHYFNNIEDAEKDFNNR